MAPCCLSISNMFKFFSLGFQALHDLENVFFMETLNSSHVHDYQSNISGFHSLNYLSLFELLQLLAPL